MDSWLRGALALYCLQKWHYNAACGADWEGLVRASYINSSGLLSNVP